MAGVTTVAAAIAGKKAIERVVDDIYNSAKDEVRHRVKHWRNTKNIASLYMKLSAVRNVKTIWQIDREVDLTEFYYPSRVTVKKRSVEINDLSGFHYDGNLVVQGIVGQGKSIFLRYLCAQELLQGRRIPLFLELRRIQKNQTVLEHLYGICTTLGLDVDEKLFASLAERGKVVLFLDGFDELKEDMRGPIITELERMAASYDSLRIIVSSRPDSGVEHSATFRTFRLDPIRQDQITAVVDKLMGDTDGKDRLLRGLNKTGSEIKQLLTTPLMITLLVITYNGYQRIPDQLSAFYEDLFSILVSRHDQTKPGFRRKRKCGLGDSDIRRVFDALCFFTKRTGELTLSNRKMLECTTRAIDECHIQCSADKFLDDIAGITCLILMEGGMFHFIHKSVQEYHTAEFIAEFAGDVSPKFYAKMLEGVWVEWSEELAFLEQIDRYRFSRHFLIPELRKTLNTLGIARDDEGQREPQRGSRLVDCLTFLLRYSHSEGEAFLEYSLDSGGLGWKFNRQPEGHVFFSLLTRAFAKPDSNARLLHFLGEPGRKVGSDACVATGAEVREADLIPGECFPLTRGMLEKLEESLADAERFVAQMDAREELFDFS